LGGCLPQLAAITGRLGGLEEMGGEQRDLESLEQLEHTGPVTGAFSRRNSSLCQSSVASSREYRRGPFFKLSTTWDRNLAQGSKHWVVFQLTTFG